MPSDDELFLRQIPKVELHLHLEGAIPLPALWELIQKYGKRSEIRSMAALEERFRYRDFAHFIETWQWMNGFLREADDFTFIAERVAQDLAGQNIRYVEAFYSPGDFAQHGLSRQIITEAIREGLRECAGSITIQLVADLVRNHGPALGMRWLQEIAEVRELGVIGIGLGGSEREFPPEPYARVYEEARRLGFRNSAHAGEAAGPESIWGAIRSLRVDRIGHGTRAVEDRDLVDYLAENRIPLEMCPTSNLRTGVVDRMDSHPIGSFYRKGLLVTVNTDDPKMFGTSLEMELRALVTAFGWRRSDVVRLLENAVEAAWCDQPTKEALREEIHRYR